MLHGLCAVNNIYSSLVNQLYAAFAGGKQGFQPLKVDVNYRPECYLTYLYIGECLPQRCSYCHLKSRKKLHQHHTDHTSFKYQVAHELVFLFSSSLALSSCRTAGLACSSFFFAPLQPSSHVLKMASNSTVVKTQWEGKAQLCSSFCTKFDKSCQVKS